MPKIEANTSRSFLIDGVPYQKGLYESVIEGDIISIIRVGAPVSKGSLIVEPTIVTDFTDDADTPLATVAAYIAYIEPFFFKSTTQTGIFTFDYLAESVDITAPPDPRFIMWNNATQASATELFLNKVTEDVQNIGNLLDALVTVGDDLFLIDDFNSDNFQRWDITQITDNTTYFTYGVTLITSNKIFTNNERLILAFR